MSFSNEYSSVFMRFRAGRPDRAFTGCTPTSPKAQTGKLSPWNPDDVVGLLIHFTLPLQISGITYAFHAHPLVLLFFRLVVENCILVHSCKRIGVMKIN